MYFSTKKYSWLISLFLLENIYMYCEYSLKVPQWGAWNAYPQHMFLFRNKISSRYHSLSGDLFELRFKAHPTYLGHVKPGQFTYYCPFDIARKNIFCFAFYFKWKYFVLIDHILSETIYLLCFCVLFSNMYPKIEFTAKNWSDLHVCNFYSKKIFFFHFYLRKYFLLFFVEFKLLMFHNNIVKISEKLNKRNLLKICL